LDGKPITLYGDGMQVRDVLFVEDLVDAFQVAQASMDALSGQAFNIGGSVANTSSLLALLDLIGKLHGEKPEVVFDAWRPGDQRYYVSDTGKFRAATGWSPRVNLRQGVQRLYEWLMGDRGETPAPVHAQAMFREPLALAGAGR
jgi:CDP-paratose 2-epimerase